MMFYGKEFHAVADYSEKVFLFIHIKPDAW